jgi:PAS domain S-box-containing protein
LAENANAKGDAPPRLIDGLVDAVVVIDDRGCVLYANPAVERLLGWKVESLFGEPLTAYLPERLRARSQSLFMEWMAADPPPRSPAPTRITILCSDGAEMPVDVGTFLVVPESGSRLVIAALWDATDRIDIERYQRVSDDLLAFLAGASGTTDEIVPQLLGILATGLEFEFATAWRWDADSGLLHCEHIWRGDRSECGSMVSASVGMAVRPGEGLAGMVASSDEPMWYDDLTQTPHLRRHDAMVTDDMHSGFIFPIRTRETLVGVIELFTTAHRKPNEPLFAAVADICARLGEFLERLNLEVERSKLLSKLRRSQRQQDFLLRANRALAGAQDFQDAIRKLAEVAVPMLGDICLIDVLEPDQTLVRMAARHADPTKQSLTDELMGLAPDLAGSHPAALAIRTGKSQWSLDMNEQFMRSTTYDEKHFELTRDLAFKSYVSVPLLTDGEGIGALTLITASSGRSFKKAELLLAEDLADQVATVIKRARVFDEQSTIARRLQSSLLPAGIDRVPGIAVASRYVASDRGAQVGGDFFDVVPIADDHVALAIGDVEGHDTTAAIVMGQLRSAMRAYFMLACEPAQVLSLLDSYACAHSTRLVTAALCVLDTNSGQLDIALAGHMPPVIFDGSSARPERLKPGPPLGVGAARYQADRIDLMPGAKLVFYTDGLIDEGRPGARQLKDRLTRSVEEATSNDCNVLADGILYDLAGSAPAVDDIALLVVHWPGPAALRDSRSSVDD